jgi:hypothetical protein
VADPHRHSLVSSTSSSQDWIAEFFKTTSNPVGHGFNLVDPANGPGFACYSFVPKSDMPIKIIVLDDTCKGTADPTNPNINYAAGCLDQARFDWLKAELERGQNVDNQLMIISAHVPVYPQTHLLASVPPSNMHTFHIPSVVTDQSLLAFLHSYKNLIMWISGHRHMNTVSPQAYDPLNPSENSANNSPENAFWEVETSSLRDFPQQFRTFDIRRNSDNNISIVVTNVDPAVAGASPAAKSRGYALGAARVFGSYDPASVASQAYNAELVKVLTTTMQGIVASKGSP